MSPWTLAAAVLLVAGLGPALWLAGRGGAPERLVGLQLGSSVTVLALMLVVQAEDQPSYLVVPIVLVPLSATGTLVFTRLLAPRPGLGSNPDRAPDRAPDDVGGGR